MLPSAFLIGLLASVVELEAAIVPVIVILEGLRRAGDDGISGHLPFQPER